MARPRVLVTGPVESLDEWCAAAASAGWEALAFPLIEIEELLPDEPTARALLAPPRVERLCVTSVHALPFLAALAQRDPALLALECSIVGQKSVGRLRAQGFTGALDWHANAQTLRASLLAADARPRSVLWPHGDKSDELARELRAAGIEVRDALAYANRPRQSGAPPPPAADLCFFASPSAVRTWSELGADCGAPRAMVIGATTFQALAGEKRCAFSDIITLSEPTSSSFAAALQHVDPRFTP